MARSDSRLSRRTCLEALTVLSGTTVLAAVATVRAEAPPSGEHGLIRPPLPLPELELVRDDGATTTLRTLTADRVTAIQLMFTACPSTCPIQGAIFSRVQRLIPDQIGRHIQLLSLSVDPTTDTPQALRRWLQTFHRRPGWLAAAPRPAATEQVRALGGRGGSPADNHSTTVQIVNRRGELVWRTAPLPSAEEIAAVLRRV